MNCRRRSRRACPPAFLLTDVMIGLFLATLILLFSLSLLQTASTGLDAAAQKAAAYNAARQVLENLRTNKGAILATGTYSNLTAFGTVPQLAQVRGGSGTIAIRTWSGQAKQAVITINWRPARVTATSSTRSVTFTGLLVSGGVAP